MARVEGGSIPELEELLNIYQFQNSNLDFFSENANNAKRLAWGDGKLADPMKTPRTTNRFIPGYDWDKDRGFFDDLGDQVLNSCFLREIRKNHPLAKTWCDTSSENVV